MIEYKTLKVGQNQEHTQDIINDYAEDGWEIVCTYCNGWYLILKRDIEDDR